MFRKFSIDHVPAWSGFQGLSERAEGELCGWPGAGVLMGGGRVQVLGPCVPLLQGASGPQALSFGIFNLLRKRVGDLKYFF